MPQVICRTGATIDYEVLVPERTIGTILLIHGFLGTGRTDLQAVGDWLMSEGYRVLAPSLRGYGRSIPKPRDFPPRFYDRDAADVLAFLDALPVEHRAERLHLFGYSDGGETALICAGMEPERFLSVATVGAVGYFHPGMRRVVQRLPSGEDWIQPQDAALHDIQDRNEFVRQWKRAMLMMINSGGDVAVRYATNYTMPILMMVGAQDALNPASNAQYFLDQGVRIGRVQVFDAGHAVHDEQPTAFQRALQQHLQETKNATR